MCYSTTRRLPVLATAIVSLIGLSGCGEELPELVPVTGKVTVMGKPLPKGVAVVFYPKSETGNAALEARGRLDAQGIYHLRTKERDGAAPGKYQVAVFAIKQTVEMLPAEWLANMRYANPKTSGLEAEVPEDSAGEFDFDLKP